MQSNNNGLEGGAGEGATGRRSNYQDNNGGRGGASQPDQ